MSVKIEILDYKYGSGNNMTNVNVGIFGTGWTAASSTNAAWDGSGSGVTYLSNISSQSLVIGRTYNLSFKITNYSGTGNMGFSTSSGVPSTARFAGNTSGIQYFTFVATSTSFPDLYGRSTNTGNISSIIITDASVIDWEKSVVGELDVTDHSDFPLAMTFQISDIKDLTSTSGDYSKTFKIPATKNNNKLLKHSYTPNIDTDVNLTENKKCRILMNNLFSVKGLIKITGVGGYGETPSYYNCVFFGSNLSWADDLSNKYMNELDWGSAGKDLEYNKTSIMATWFNYDCDSSTSPIVYPIVSYGEYNPDGQPKTIQLLDTKGEHYNQSSSYIGYYGFFNDGSSYETPNPSADWRPAVFVKDTLEKIFSQVGEVGYTINSTFMETDMFKKLVWLLPNFKYNNAEERYNEYSAEATFDTSIALTEFELEHTFTGTQYSYEYENHNVDFGTINTNFTLSNDTSSTDITYVGGAEGFQIAEYGYYNLKASGFSAELSNLLQNGAVPAIQYNVNAIRYPELYIDRIQFKLEVKTVGQTTWNSIDVAEDTTTIEFVGSVGSSGTSGIDLIDASNSYLWDVNGSINNEGYWLNKDDRVRISFYAKFKPHNDAVSPVWVGSGDWSFDVIPTIGEFDITLNSEAVAYGQTYDLDEVINKDYKQIDFVKGIAHAFNLKMTTDETTRTVNIEPFNTFYKDYADAIDWTYKLDRSRQIEDKWIQSDLKRDVVFQYKPDSKDKKVEQRGEVWWNGIKDEYPYQETLPKTFEKGESKYENPFFAGTYNTKDQETIMFPSIPERATYSAVLWEGTPSSNSTERPPKGYEFLPRLLYWNKYAPLSTTIATNKRAYIQTWQGVVEPISAGLIGSGAGYLASAIPQATSINIDDSSSPILSYGNVSVRDYDDATGVYSSPVAGKGLFETYYKNMFEMFKAKPRLRTVYIDLKTTDIINLDFRKLVYIDGVYWRINKVVDYQPNKNQPTKVELVEWLQLGAFAATAPSFGGNNNTGGLGWQDGGVEQDNDDIGL